jgi:hypothetical protein
MTPIFFTVLWGEQPAMASRARRHVSFSGIVSSYYQYSIPKNFVFHFFELEGKIGARGA